MTTTDSSRTPKGRAPHRRDENARVAVLHAADDLLVERGFDGVTIEGIAARAGVAKQTIYRWWTSKVDILLDTLTDDADRALTIAEPGPDAAESGPGFSGSGPGVYGPGSAVEAVRGYLRTLAGFLTEDPAGKVLLALIGQAQHDPAVAGTFRERYLDPRRQDERAMLKRGIDSGELPAGLDVDAALDALTGPVLYRALTGTPITRAFTDWLVTVVLEHPAG